MDMHQTHKTDCLPSSDTVTRGSASKTLKSLASEQEPARWPLQIVDDNAAASRHLTASHAHQKRSNEPEYSGYQRFGDRHLLATYHPPSRPRRGPEDPTFSRDLTARSFDDEHSAHERRIKSYRDTTSEIISLYATQNAMAQNSALPRAEDEASTTASHPRQPASLHHIQPISTHIRNTSWQKSRTPGLYPTRLRRPGTSIASPTMTEPRVRDSNRMMESERGQQKVIHNCYKSSLANNQRRAPPLSLRAEMNRSSSSLPSRYSPGPNHYMTASGRARTPSSTVSWASRPSDRYGMGSTDQSSRSASLTSIVEMYQRPMTSSSTCPAMRPSGTLYYDYSEDFSYPSPESGRESDMPLSPMPHRADGAMKPTILQQDMELKMNGTTGNPRAHRPTQINYRGCYSRADSSIEDSFDSYLQGSHDDSIEEIERAIANAISNAAADKLMAASEHLNAYTDAYRDKREDIQPNLTNGNHVLRRLPATERQYGLKTAAPNMEMNINARRASQLSLNKNNMALDPAFADFTSLLSSFERLAKSPFSRLSDEDDVDERHSKRSSKLSTMETLDEIEAMDNPYLKRHARNLISGRAGTPALSTSESLTEQPLSSGLGTLVLTPQPLSPQREKKTQNELQHRFMKALPPLPAEMFSTQFPHIHDSADKHSKNDSAISQVRSLSLRSHISRSGSPGKLRLRVRTPSSSGDMNQAVGAAGARRERRSADECRTTKNFKPPPKLKLKISRSQLGHGRSTHTGSVVRNNRLKQCNALADVARPPRVDIDERVEEASDIMREKDGNVFHENLAIHVDQRGSVGGSCQPSDQFNLSYPSTPVESTNAILPKPGSRRESIEEIRTVQSEAVEPASHRIKPKFSFLRLRSVNQATPATLTKPAPSSDGETGTNLPEKNIYGTSNSRIDTTTAENTASSVSVKSERVGNRMKRWATDAKRVVRSYVRRTLIRTPKSATN